MELREKTAVIIGRNAQNVEVNRYLKKARWNLNKTTLNF